MGQGKAGWLIAGFCGAVVLTSIGYGLGRRAALKSIGSSISVAPAGAPLPAIQIEPIQPQEELAAIGSTAPAQSQTPASSGTPTAAQTMNAQTPNPATSETAKAAQPTEESSRIREIQMALRTAGFDPGSSDGKMGPRTRAAIRDFQLANGLEADGKVGSRTWSKLETILQKKSTSGQSTD